MQSGSASVDQPAGQPWDDETVNQLVMGVLMSHQLAEKNRGGTASGTKLLEAVSQQKKRIRGTKSFAENPIIHILNT